MADSGTRKQYSFKRNLSLRKSNDGGTSAPGQLQRGANKSPTFGSSGSSKANMFKPPVKDVNQMSMKSFFSKASSTPSSQSSSSSNVSPAGMGIKSFLQQTSKPVAQVAPLGNGPFKPVNKTPAAPTNKAPAVSPGILINLEDLDDDDDFDFASMKFTPKAKTPASHKSVIEQDENKQSEDEDMVIGCTKNKGKRKIVISDEEDDEVSGNFPGPMQDKNLPAATMPLFTQDLDELETEIPDLSGDEDENWSYLDIPPASPPPEEVLQAELESQPIDEFETEDVGAELAFADGLVKKPTVAVSSFQQPPSKRPRQEMIGSSLNNRTVVQETPPKSLQKHTPSATVTRRSFDEAQANETMNKVKNLLNEQDNLLERICCMVRGLKLEHLMTIEGFDFQEIPKILAKRETLKKEYSQVSNHLSELANNKNAQQHTNQSVFKPQIAAFKSPAMSPAINSAIDSAGKHVRIEEPSGTPQRPGILKNPRKSEGGADSDFDFPPCGDSFFDDPNPLPSTLATFRKTSSARNSPNNSIQKLNTSSNLDGETSFNGGAAFNIAGTSFNNPSTSFNNPGTSFKNPGTSFNNPGTSFNNPGTSFNDNSTLKPFKFDYNINTANTSKQAGGGDGFDEPFSDSMFDLAMQEEEEIMNELPSTTPTKSQTKPSHTPSKTGYSPSGTIVRRAQIRDDSCSGQFDGFNFPHSEEMRNIFQGVFGLRDFRTNQLQAINAALLNHDCFILMPTGGGKSLCYQLPALVNPGITIVISPLKSLIQDQVQRLCSLNIGAAHISGEVSQSDAQAIYNRMFLKYPDISLLYVTPEKICASEKFQSVLRNLHQRQKLNRFVIDEAHCVSQWGHDFRPDYKRLNMLRENYPGVPMMAVTATATPRVRKDILHQLGMKDCKWFNQSFNRPNLKFMVKPKKGKSLAKDVVDIIKREFNKKSGIVYCLSRNECDQTAKELKNAGIAAESYHAGLSDNARNSVQERWLNEHNCKVVCATIAFGMGIDKPDVRFVLHYSLPKSVEGYYQECGRAGRDGRLATCILYYSYADVMRLRKIIEMDPSANYEAKKVHLDNLYRMVQFGENCVECRRTQMLDYFGEQFDSKTCGNFPGAMCDNCSSTDVFSTEDVTEEVKTIVKGIDQVVGSGRFTNNFTLLHFVEIYKGSKIAKIVDSGHDKLAIHGRAKKLNYMKTDVERLFRHLVVEGILAEQLVVSAQDHTFCYLKLGTRAKDVLNGRFKVKFQFQKKLSKAAAERPVVIQDDPVELMKNECYENLVQLAKQIAEEMGYKSYNMVFSSDALTEMSQTLPIMQEDMEKISGVGKVRMRNYGDRFLAITANYALMIGDMEDMQDFPQTDIPESLNFTEDHGNDHSEPEDLMEGSKYFHHEPSIMYEGGKRGRGGGKRFGYKKKGTGRGRGKKRASSASSSSSGWLSKSNGGANTSASNYSFTSKPRGGRGRGRGRATSTTTSAATGRKPGLMGAPKSSRSFLGGSGTFFG